MSSRSSCGSLVCIGLAMLFGVGLGLAARESAAADTPTEATVKVGQSAEVRARLDNQKLVYTDAKTGRATAPPSGVALSPSANPPGLKITGTSGTTRVALAQGDITIDIPAGASAIVKEDRVDGMAKVTISTSEGSAVSGLFTWVSRGRTLGMAYELGSTVTAVGIPAGGWRIETENGKTILIGGDGTRIVVESGPDGANDVVTITVGDVPGTVKITVVAGSVIKITTDGAETVLEVGETFTVETAVRPGTTTVFGTQPAAAPTGGGGTFSGR